MARGQSWQNFPRLLRFMVLFPSLMIKQITTTIAATTLATQELELLPSTLILVLLLLLLLLLLMLFLNLLLLLRLLSLYLLLVMQLAMISCFF